MNKATRKPVIAGNWKMNMTPSKAKALIDEMKPLVAGADCEVVLCVPFVDIPTAVEAANGSNIKIGAENVHFKASGSFTVTDYNVFNAELCEHISSNFTCEST